MKTIEAVAKPYRGILIFETMSGFVVFVENDRQYDFVTRSEAEAFIDAWIVASMTVTVTGVSPVQMKGINLGASPEPLLPLQAAGY